MRMALALENNAGRCLKAVSLWGTELGDFHIISAFPNTSLVFSSERVYSESYKNFTLALGGITETRPILSPHTLRNRGPEKLHTAPKWLGLWD